MRDEFHGLSMLWREEGDQQSGDTLLIQSTRSIRRARRHELIELTLAGVIALVVAYLAVRRGTLAPFIAGSVLLLVLLLSSRQRYRSRRMEWLAEGGDRLTFLRGAMSRMRARMRRTMWSAILLAPASVLGTILARTARTGGLDMATKAGSADESSLAMIALGVGSLVAMLAYLLVRLHRQRAQLSRLRDTYSAYRDEEALDSADSASRPG